MPGNPISLGPFKGGLHNSSGSGESIKDDELFDLVNMEVDIDGSLANRPAIGVFKSTGWGNAKVLGAWYLADGRKYIIVSNDTPNIAVLNTATGVNDFTIVGGISTAVVQSADRLYIIPSPASAGWSGGYLSVASAGATPTFTSVATIPNGDSCAVYKDRIFVAAGISSSTNTSRLYYSWALDGTQWNNVAGNNSSGGFADVDPGNGQKLVMITVLNNDIILLKQHSTYRYTFTSIPARADIFKISATIGCPAIGCAVTYDNNNVYVLHDNNVYELYNYTYTKIGINIALRQIIDASLFASDIYGLTLYRDRLFIRYYSDLYVFSLKTQRWSRWVSTRKFSRIVSVASADVGLDTAYAHTASSDTPGQIFSFQDDRIKGVGTTESFNCTIQTKTYDLNIPYSYKVLTWWGISIATLGNTTGTISVPNAGQNYTWGFLKTNYTWGTARANILWSNKDKILFSVVVPPSLGKYARKFIKYPKKLRFRQLNFTIDTVAVSNTIADASVRIWDVTAFILQKETVVHQTS